MGVEDGHQVLPGVLDADDDADQVVGMDGVDIRRGIRVAGGVVGGGAAGGQRAGEDAAGLVWDLCARVGQQFLPPPEVLG